MDVIPMGNPACDSLLCLGVQHLCLCMHIPVHAALGPPLCHNQHQGTQSPCHSHIFPRCVS